MFVWLIYAQWISYSLTCSTVIAIPARDNLHARTVLSKIGRQRQVEAQRTFSQGWDAFINVENARSSGNWQAARSMCMGQRLRQGQTPAQYIHASEPASVFIFLSATHIATGS